MKSCIASFMGTFVRTRFLRLSLAVLCASAMVSAPLSARADQTREFLLSCTYGALAGSIVGAATLAFSDKPGDNLNKVARGASIGLYAGILLGLYVVYGNTGDDDDAAAALGVKASLDLHYKQTEPPRLQLAPLIGDKGFEGGYAQANVLRF